MISARQLATAANSAALRAKATLDSLIEAVRIEEESIVREKKERRKQKGQGKKKMPKEDRVATEGAQMRRNREKKSTKRRGQIPSRDKERARKREIERERDAERERIRMSVPLVRSLAQLRRPPPPSLPQRVVRTVASWTLQPLGLWMPDEEIVSTPIQVSLWEVLRLICVCERVLEVEEVA